MVMTPYDYQTELAKHAFAILKDYGIVYLAMEERTGKSITGLLVLEESKLVTNVLVITKKKALDGWQETLAGCPWLIKKYQVVNYHSAHKVDPTFYDAIILDEAHTYISSYPKRGKIWKDLCLICHNRPIVYMSATPYAQGIQLLFNQFALSVYSPWTSYRDFYAWYKVYAKRDKNGQTDALWLGGRRIETYKKVDYDKALKDVEHLFITKTRKSLGFEQEPEDVIHYLTLAESTKAAYNILLKHRVLEFEVDGKDYTLVADSKIKLRYALHMLEGGVLKVDDNYICLNMREKIDYILDKWGDTDKVTIMYQYIAEGDKLKSVFKNASILQGTSYAEGVDLSHIEHLIIYSQDFSTAKHTQRRARQANKKRTQAIKVHFLLVKKAVSSQVYNSVSKNKVNFVDSLFEQEEI